MTGLLLTLLALQMSAERESAPVAATDPWKNLPNLFGAYALIFTAIFVYTWILGMRQKRLDKKIDELKEALKEPRSDRRR